MKALLAAVSAAALFAPPVLAQPAGATDNPKIDNLERLSSFRQTGTAGCAVGNTGANYVVNPNDGSLQLTATPVAYGAGDPNAGRSPVVTAVAYTPSAQTGNTADSQLYAIDSSRAADVFARLANNTGVLTTVGTTGVDFGPRDSFDIDGTGAAFALDGNQLYSANLQTGAFSFLGLTDRPLFGLSAQVAAVPEPATWAMMLVGFGLMGGAMRRRTRVTFAAA